MLTRIHLSNTAEATGWRDMPSAPYQSVFLQQKRLNRQAFRQGEGDESSYLDSHQYLRDRLSNFVLHSRYHPSERFRRLMNRRLQTPASTLLKKISVMKFF